MAQQHLQVKGFNLIELTVVIAILGVIAVVSIPYYQRFQVKSKRAEAINNVSMIYTLEKSYYNEEGTYGELTSFGRTNCPAAVNEINFQLTNCAKVRYEYYTSAHSQLGFEASAASTLVCKSGSPDMVSINDDKRISITSCLDFEL